MTRIFLAGALLLFLIFAIYQSTVLINRRSEVREKYAGVREKLDTLLKEEERITSELKYFANPMNLEKELRARFHYKLPSERMLIFVPGIISSSTRAE